MYPASTSHAIATATKCLIHPTAKFGKNVKVESDVVIGKYAVIGNNVTIGLGARIGDCVHIGPNSSIGARAIINHKTIIQPNVTIEKGVATGDHCFFGSRCVVGKGVIIGSNVQLWGQNHVAAQTYIDDDQFIGEFIQLERDSVYRSIQGLADSLTIWNGIVYSKFAKPMSILEAISAYSTGCLDKTKFLRFLHESLEKTVTA